VTHETRELARAAGVLVGMALEAWDWFFDGLVTDDRASMMNHVQIADAYAVIREAEQRAERLAALVADWSEELVAEAEAELATVCRLTCDATYVLGVISGPATEPGPAVIRRIARDLEAAADNMLGVVTDIRKEEQAS
jgi:hypothetical protein